MKDDPLTIRPARMSGTDKRLAKLVEKADHRARALDDLVSALQAEQEALEKELAMLRRLDAYEAWRRMYREGRITVMQRRKEYWAARRELIKRIQADKSPDKWKYCPVDPEKSPTLRRAIGIILDHFRVTWADLLQSDGRQHVRAARLALYVVLEAAGMDWYQIAALVWRGDPQDKGRAIRKIVEKQRPRALSFSCVPKAIACVKHMNQAELDSLTGVSPALSDK